MVRPRRSDSTDPTDLMFQALGDPTRRRLVEMLGTRPHAVTTLAGTCGITITAIGQHIRVLEKAGLVTSSKLGRVRSCQLDPDGLAILQRWLDARRSAWEKRLDALGAQLARKEEDE